MDEPTHCTPKLPYEQIARDHRPSLKPQPARRSAKQQKVADRALKQMQLLRRSQSDNLEDDDDDDESVEDDSDEDRDDDDMDREAVSFDGELFKGTLKPWQRCFTSVTVILQCWIP